MAECVFTITTMVNVFNMVAKHIHMDILVRVRTFHAHVGFRKGFVPFHGYHLQWMIIVGVEPHWPQQLFQPTVKLVGEADQFIWPQVADEPVFEEPIFVDEFEEYVLRTHLYHLHEW